MAVLQNIRNRAGVLIIIFVGVALFLFIIDPSTFKGLFNKPETNIAKINGEKVSMVEYKERLNEVKRFVMEAQQTKTLDAETEQQLRDQVWQEVINDYLLFQHFEDDGIAVSESEMEDMLYGAHIHPIIKQNFGDPQTGMIDTNYVRQFFETGEMDQRFVVITDYLKSQIRQNRKLTKYTTLLSQGMYTPTALAKADYLNSETKVNFAYIALNFKEIKDESVEISDADLKSYYEAHPYRFQSDERAREIDYVVFDITPNAEDSAIVEKQMETLHENFKDFENAQEFAKIHSEEVLQKPFFAKGEVPAGYGEAVFAEEEPGFLSDIFTQDTSYMMFKVADFRIIPDSVKARHILIEPNENRSYQQAYLFLDSIKQEIDAGADFAEMARIHSNGPSSVKGGDLGWFTEGAMVPQFDDACFYGKAGDMPLVATEFGVHLIDIQEQSDGERVAELAIVKKKIDASTDTYNKVYSKASKFASLNNTAESFDKAIVEQGLVKRIASNMLENDQEIPGLKDSRILIKWAFNEDKGSVSQAEEIRSENCFVVAKLTQVREEGLIDFEYVKSEIEPIVLKKKKAAMQIEKAEAALKQYNDLKAIAGNLSKTVDTAKNIAFNSFSVPRLGIEPELIAKATSSEPNTGIVGPIEGNNGVYVFSVFNKTEAPEVENYETQRAKISSTQKNRVNYEMMEALMKASDITDNRSKFF
ncbi:MAG: SurA N-terminal domain-containing protein [Bacteroidales bacterium]|jgi:peptidyl-prolyl cis-trans isomerase D|nr:SurA N-terminal domain-containing protein [Bacteroidales bacterium]